MRINHPTLKNVSYDVPDDQVSAWEKLGWLPDAGVSTVPAKSASKAEWEAYARSQGATDADLDGKTRDDLITTYGKA